MLILIKGSFQGKRAIVLHDDGVLSGTLRHTNLSALFEHDIIIGTHAVNKVYPDLTPHIYVTNAAAGPYALSHRGLSLFCRHSAAPSEELCDSTRSFKVNCLDTCLWHGLSPDIALLSALGGGTGLQATPSIYYEFSNQSSHIMALQFADFLGFTDIVVVGTTYQGMPVKYTGDLLQSSSLIFYEHLALHGVPHNSRHGVNITLLDADPQAPTKIFPPLSLEAFKAQLAPFQKGLPSTTCYQRFLLGLADAAANGSSASGASEGSAEVLQPLLYLESTQLEDPSTAAAGSISGNYTALQALLHRHVAAVSSRAAVMSNVSLLLHCTQSLHTPWAHLLPTTLQYRVPLVAPRPITSEEVTVVRG